MLKDNSRKLAIKDLQSESEKPNLGSGGQRQEKPDLQEPPESAPAGILLLPLAAQVAPEITLRISGLPQALQVIEEISEEASILSKTFPHPLQENL